MVQDSITEVEPESEQTPEMEEDQTLDEMEDLVQTEDWTEEELEMDIDETDLEELDKEIELALEEEYGISSETISALSLGKDIKMCGNCGRICEGELKECPVCHQPLEGGKVEAEMETEEWDVESAQSTLIQALGISDVPDEVSEDETGSLGVCTICGAFLTEGTERCPVCGSKVSETPEIEYDEEDTFVHRTDDKLFICDACGAFVGADQKFCPVCGSDLEFARRKVEEEDLESIGDNTQDILDSFFGEIDGVEIEEEMKNKKLTFCDVCGALVIEGADRCSICLSLLDEEKSEEEDLQGFEFYFGEDEISEEEMEEFDEEINVSEVDEDFTPEVEEESQVDVSEEIMKEVDRELELEEEEDISEADVEEPAEIDEEGFEEGEEVIIDEDLLERELELDIEEEPESLEMQEDEDATEDDFQIYEEVDEVGEIEEVEEPEPSEEEEIDIESILEEISEENEKVTAETTEKPLDEGGEFGYYRVEESDHSGEPLDEELETDDLNEDEWTHCPNCDSYVSDDSEVCGVCGYSFEESGIHERNVSMYHKKIERGSDISSASGTEVNTHDSSWINEILQEADSSSSKKKRRGKVRKESEDENLLVSTVNRIKEYEVPVSSLSLVAFGGFYLYSYQNSSLPNIADIGLTILALFFGLGILTLYVFKEDLIRTSQTGVLGYLIGFGLASFVPLHCTVLSISLPLILDTLLIGIALGIFMILDFKIDQDYRYYLMWFVGIALLMLILILVKITDTGGLTTLAYPLLMSIGLGSILVMGGTYNWYNRAQSDTNTYENIQMGHRHLLYGDYKKAVSSFDKAIKSSSQMDKDGDNIDYAESPLYSKGLAQCSMGMYEDAVETFKEVLSLAPESVACWNNLGTTYSRMGKQKLAVKCLKKSLKLEPEYEISWNNLGNAMFRKGEYDKALDCYDMALDINPNYRDATLNKNQCLIKLGTSKTR